MNRQAFALVLLGALTGPALWAAEPVKSETVVHGVKLATLCDHCAVVTGVHSETRKGKASGVGAVGGAVVGGVLGHQLGGGSGKTATTAIGAVGGGIAGNEIEKQAKKHTVWVTSVTLKNGAKHHYDSEAAPGLKAGDVVRVENGHLVKHAP
jgi:uncharacterized protein YcfJ